MNQISEESFFDNLFKSSTDNSKQNRDIITDSSKRMQAFKQAQGLVEKIIKSFDMKFQKSTSKNKDKDYIKKFIEVKYHHVVLFWYNMRNFSDNRNKQIVLEEYENKYIDKFFRKLDEIKNKIPGFFIEYTKNNTYEGFVQLTDTIGAGLESYNTVYEKYEIDKINDPELGTIYLCSDKDTVENVTDNLKVAKKFIDDEHPEEYINSLSITLINLLRRYSIKCNIKYGTVQLPIYIENAIPDFVDNHRKVLGEILKENASMYMELNDENKVWNIVEQKMVWLPKYKAIAGICSELEFTSKYCDTINEQTKLFKNLFIITIKTIYDINHNDLWKNDNMVLSVNMNYMAHYDFVNFYQVIQDFFKNLKYGIENKAECGLDFYGVKIEGESHYAKKIINDQEKAFCKYAREELDIDAENIETLIKKCCSSSSIDKEPDFTSKYIEKILEDEMKYNSFFYPMYLGNSLTGDKKIKIGEYECYHYKFIELNDKIDDESIGVFNLYQGLISTLNTINLSINSKYKIGIYRKEIIENQNITNIESFDLYIVTKLNENDAQDMNSEQFASSSSSEVINKYNDASFFNFFKGFSNNEMQTFMGDCNNIESFHLYFMNRNINFKNTEYRLFASFGIDKSFNKKTDEKELEKIYKLLKLYETKVLKPQNCSIVEFKDIIGRKCHNGIMLFYIKKGYSTSLNNFINTNKNKENAKKLSAKIPMIIHKGRFLSAEKLKKENIVDLSFTKEFNENDEYDREAAYNFMKTSIDTNMIKLFKDHGLKLSPYHDMSDNSEELVVNTTVPDYYGKNIMKELDKLFSSKYSRIASRLSCENKFDRQEPNDEDIWYNRKYGLLLSRINIIPYNEFIENFDEFIEMITFINKQKFMYCENGLFSKKIRAVLIIPELLDSININSDWVSIVIASYLNEKFNINHLYNIFMHNLKTSKSKFDLLQEGTIFDISYQNLIYTIEGSDIMGVYNKEAYSIYSVPNDSDPSTRHLKSADENDPIHDRFNSTKQTTSNIEYNSEMDETEEFYLHDLQKIPLVNYYVNELNMTPKTAVNVIESFLAENPYLNMYLINESMFKTQEEYDDALLEAFIAATEACNGNVDLYNDALDYSTEYFYNIDEAFYTTESVVKNRGLIDRAKHSIVHTLSPIAKNIVQQVDDLIGDSAARKEVIAGSSLLKARRLFLKMIVMWKIPAILSALSILPGGWLGLVLKIVIWVGSKASSLSSMKKMVSTVTGVGNSNDGAHDENTKLVLNELDLELKITREKIDDAKSKGDNKAKYALMRIENNIEREIFRIKYGKTPEHGFVGNKG